MLLKTEFPVFLVLKRLLRVIIRKKAGGIIKWTEQIGRERVIKRQTGKMEVVSVRRIEDARDLYLAEPQEAMTVKNYLIAP